MKKIFFVGQWLFILVLPLSLAAQSLPKIKLEPVFSKLRLVSPVWMSEAPDGTGRFFIVEQDGRIVIVQKGADGSQAKEFLNIEDRKPHVGTEEGLLSMAFHPGFKTNGLFYIYYNQQNHHEKISGDVDQSLYPRRSVISEFHVDANDPDKADLKSERILLQVPQPFPNHKGGELAFGPDGYLYLGLGDGGKGWDPFNNGQNSAAFLGKILRIDVNHKQEIAYGKEKRTLPYAYPPDNPFINEMSGPPWMAVRKEIYALGLRNPWRFSFDKQTGDLWCGDVGQDLWEEVDLIVKGGNYGWNVREGAHHFKPAPPGAQYIDPVMEYPHKPQLLAESLFPNHSIGMCVVGGYVYRGQKYPALQGIYIYADYTLGTIWGLRYENGKVIEQDQLLSQPKNIPSFAEDNDGEVYVLTGQYQSGDQPPVPAGKIFQIAPTP
jgi:quinoprotein glucose dehydrogenase